jgi:hypothetical protein
MINRRRSGARGTPAKVNATAGLEASEGVNSASVSDGSHESVYLGPFCVPTPICWVGAMPPKWRMCFRSIQMLHPTSLTGHEILTGGCADLPSS